MKYIGTYKAVKAAKLIEGQGFVFEEINKMLSETTDPGQKHTLEQTARTLLIVDENANINNAMEIPSGTPAEEIEKAKSRGMIITEDGKFIITKQNKGKIENNELYFYEPTKFLAGTEWVKISTDKEDELNLVTTIYKKI
ncbi:MAG: hypothetical protein MJ211_03825 [Bacteroidales bacterium]|nr:hypothetical protein [Bacteroidales bacterium]